MNWLDILRAERVSTNDGQGGLRFYPVGKDPVANLFVVRLRLTPVGMFLVAAVLVAIAHLLALAGYVFYQGGDLVGRFASWQFGEVPVIASLWLAVPGLVAFYPWMVRTSSTLYQRLHDEEVLVGELESARPLVVGQSASIMTLTNHIGWVWFATVVAIVSEVGLFAQGLGGAWDMTPHIGGDIWLFHAIAAPFNMLAIYIITSIVGRYISTVVGLWRVFDASERTAGAASIQVRPWHPDRCGGLGILRDYALRISWFVAIGGIALLLFAYISLVMRLELDTTQATFFSDLWGAARSLPTLGIAVVIYLLLSPLIFFLTLGAANRAMTTAKRDQLRAISNRLDAAYRQTQEALIAPARDLRLSVNEITSLKKLYDLNRTFPVWPFDVATLGRFGTATLAPLVTFGASLVLQLLIG